MRREDRSDYVGADSLYPWPHVAEPHRATVLELDGAAATAWAVEGERPNGGADATRALHTFSRTGRHGVRVGAGGDSHDFTVMVKYVRREIRNMGDADREGFLGRARGTRSARRTPRPRGRRGISSICRRRRRP